MRRLVGGPGLLCFLCACGPHVQSSAVATAPMTRAYTGRVVLRAGNIPPGSTQLGIVEAHGDTVDIEKVMPEFVNRVAKLGGNFGKIDDIRTHFETHQVSETYTYSCGTTKQYRSCTGTRTQAVEVATTTIAGRAFRTVRKP